MKNFWRVFIFYFFRIWYSESIYYGNGFMQGRMKYTKRPIKQSADMQGSTKCTKLMMHEMYQFGQIVAKFEYEYSRIEFALPQFKEHKLWVSDQTHVDVVAVVVRVLFLCLVVWYVRFIKLSCIRCRCGMIENIVNFALSPFAWYTWNSFCHQSQNNVGSVVLLGNSK